MAWRVDQLANHGIHHEVVCNRGGKGSPVSALVERHSASAAVFIDDLAVHHASVAKHAPDVWRLHMIAEPRLAAITPPAPDAHARIDDWPTAMRVDPGTIRRGKMTKTIFITGATAGIGAAAARRFANGGWRVIATGRRADRLRALARRARRGLPAAGARHARLGCACRGGQTVCRRGATSTCCSTMPGSRRRWRRSRTATSPH